ncbi:MAG: hypothetical protein EBY40_01125 [Marivivens sp.]|nr:hypothetical protein [Marivivens sp.]NBT49996.1 hypothetical protein [Marivivens sp.]NCW67380.1 hypothetical protein [Marivivens sp.]NDH01710.1 hypothetical protein [Marivivens sp.]
MTTTRYNHGIARLTDNGIEWYPFGYDEPRLAKPHPCFCNDCPRLHEIAAELGPEWQVREATKMDRQNVKIADADRPSYGEPVSVLHEPRQKNRDADLTDEKRLIQS